MGHIKFEKDGIECLTECPYNKHLRIGSWGCEKCEHFKGFFYNYVRCYFSEKDKDNK